MIRSGFFAAKNARTSDPGCNLSLPIHLEMQTDKTDGITRRHAIPNQELCILRVDRHMEINKMKDTEIIGAHAAL